MIVLDKIKNYPAETCIDYLSDVQKDVTGTTGVVLKSLKLANMA